MVPAAPEPPVPADASAAADGMGAGSEAELAAWVTAARSGSRPAWSRLCRAQAPRLAGYLGARLRRPLVVETVIQDALVAAWDRRMEIPAPPATDAWFRRLAAGQARRWRAEHPHEPLAEAFPAERCADPAQSARMRRLDEALARLGEAERLALEQHWRGGLSGPALAAALHLPSAAEAEAQIARALDALEQAMGS
jgi:DNA-directed RNA polymerase specialized sigma24 family protein